MKGKNPRQAPVSASVSGWAKVVVAGAAGSEREFVKPTPWLLRPEAQPLDLELMPAPGAGAVFVEQIGVQELSFKAFS